jgi:hypothetical protein
MWYDIISYKYINVEKYLFEEGGESKATIGKPRLEKYGLI